VPDAALPSLQGVKVLVVEDDEATGYILSKQLGPTGAIVTTVGDATQALDVLRSRAVDVLVVDLLLPGMNGLELLANVPPGARLAIAVTAFDDTMTQERALRAGFNLYLRTPVDPHVLAQEIARRVGPR
jgi:CheY-like chemotaxis protein